MREMQQAVFNAASLLCLPLLTCLCSMMNVFRRYLNKLNRPVPNPETFNWHIKIVTLRLLGVHVEIY